MKKRVGSMVFLAISLLFSAFASAEEVRLMRFPNIHGDKIVFSYAGDLYIVNSNGGTARRLTSHIGYEMFPRFSPDGKTIAFTGQYDGNSEVYIIPSEGGDPKRVTYTATLSRDDIGDRMGPNNIVIDWTPDGKNILYRTRNYSFNDFTGQLMLAPVNGGMPTPLPLKNGGFASYSPDGKYLAYNYIFREFRTWKRYEGGMADDIRVFDFKSKSSENITNNRHQDIAPMWSSDGNKIYYISDRDGYMNLYGYNVGDKTTKQLTNYREYDIKFPSIGNSAIVYENGGYIYRYDLVSGKAVKVSISIQNDLIYSRPQWKELSDKLSSASLSPNGERVLLVARGDLFSVPAKSGITYNYTNSSYANDHSADWSPDGASYGYISDREGEFNIYVRDHRTGHEKKITDIKGYIFDFKWSPDSKKILWSDKENRLTMTEIASGKSLLIERSDISPLNDFNWSPDGRYIVFTRPCKEKSVIVVYDVERREKHDITDEWYSSDSPNFSKDGKYLLFVSDRTFNPTYSQTEWNHAYTKMSKIYIIPLARGAENLFAPKNDTIAIVKADLPEANVGSKVENGDSKSVKSLEYSFENIAERTVELPVPPSNYGGLNMIGNSVYFNTHGGTSLYDVESEKITNLKANIVFGAGYKKALAISGKSLQVIDIPKSEVAITKAMDLSGVRKLVNYREEWEQIYRESWRQMRDLFYAKNMHGVDWDKVYSRYAVLVPFVNHRSDLTYIIGEMIGELNVGHAYSQNGESPQVERISMGMLGGYFSKDPSGFFRVDRVTSGANWSKETRSPLTMPSVNVKEGDYILSINGKSLTDVDNLQKALIGTAGRVIEMVVNSSPAYSGSRTVLVEPLRDLSKLNYYNWVESNIRKVNEATNGEVGYIHIPDMGVDGLNEFVKHYYPQLGKKALIIDDRGNGGGNVSPMIIERLKRTITYLSMHTNQKEGTPSPVGTFDGPKVLLINEYSASDGDLFPYRFKYNKLGTVIGRRTWGGVVGYSGTIPVVDGGSIVTPSYAPFAVDGSGWIIEGEGVSPDIDQFNDPYKDFMGEDEQLNRAIESAKTQIKSYHYRSMKIPPFPNKSVKR